MKTIKKILTAAIAAILGTPAIMAADTEASINMASYSDFAGYMFLFIIFLFFSLFLYTAARPQRYTPRPQAVFNGNFSGDNPFLIQAFNIVYYAFIVLIILQVAAVGINIL